VRIDDLAAETRWPRFGPAAAGLGLRSTLSFRLYVHDEEFGALNLYSATPHAFTEDSYVVGEMFARHSAMALAEAEHRHQFNEALSTRDVIGQAKGILMHRDRLTAEEAFDLLARTSQNGNVKLVELARWLVEQTEQAGADQNGP
jgi:GAF domain-containing protein